MYAFPHLQDIGVQGYSTLHCIRERGVEVTMATPLDHVPLGSMRPLSPQHATLNTSTNHTDRRKFTVAGL